MLKEINDFTSRILHPIVKFVCGVTGKSNFSIARIVILIALSSNAVASIFVRPWMIFLVLMTLETLSSLSGINKNENAIADGESVMPWRAIQLLDGLTFWTGFISLLLSFISGQSFINLLGIGSIVIFETALFIAADTQGPSKSAFSRGLEWIKAYTAKYWSHTPAPRPMPI